MLLPLSTFSHLLHFFRLLSNSPSLIYLPTLSHLYLSDIYTPSLLIHTLALLTSSTSKSQSPPLHGELSFSHINSLFSSLTALLPISIPIHLPSSLTFSPKTFIPFTLSTPHLHPLYPMKSIFPWPHPHLLLSPLSYPLCYLTLPLVPSSYSLFPPLPLPYTSTLNLFSPPPPLLLPKSHAPTPAAVFQPLIARCGTTNSFSFTNTYDYRLCLTFHLSYLFCVSQPSIINVFLYTSESP